MRIMHMSLAGLWLKLKSGGVFGINLHGWSLHRPTGSLVAAANFPRFWHVIDFDPPA